MRREPITAELIDFKFHFLLISKPTLNIKLYVVVLRSSPFEEIIAENKTKPVNHKP